MSEKLISLLRKTSRHHQPWQIAVAIVVGCAFGLMPKTNLTFPLALAVLFVLPIHLPMAAACIACFSLIAPWMHPIQGAIGTWLLESGRTRRLVDDIDQIPFAPWLRLHNSVVAGALFASSVTALPLFMVVHRFLLVRYTQWLAIQSQARFEQEYAERQKLANVMLFRKAVAIDQSQASDESELVDSIHELGTLLRTPAAAESGERVDSNVALARAIKTAELIDDLVSSLVEEEPVAGALPGNIERKDATHTIENFHAHDTKITLSRVSSTQAESMQLSIDGNLTTNPFMLSNVQAPQPTRAPIITPNASKSATLTGSKDKLHSAASPQMNNLNADLPHEEALRNLLNHLRTNKDEA